MQCENYNGVKKMIKFGTGGWRAIIADDFTKATIRLLTAGLCELMLKEGQKAPMHFHWVKSEDIINRGGGTLIIHVYDDKGDGSLSPEDVTINSDGRSYQAPAGTGVELKPGESLTLWPHQYHDFEVKPGTGDVLIGEVSMCNDDNADNRFYQEMGRFPAIEEDEPPYRLLCFEYPKAVD